MCYRWDKEVWDIAHKMEQDNEGKYKERVFGIMEKNNDYGTIASQAKALLSGKEKWRPSWMDYGPPQEVELELDVSRERER